VPALGLIVNPIAGIGGRLALKGSDDRDAVERAARAGAPPVAPARARRALDVIRAQCPRTTVLAAGGEMGAEVASERQLEVTLVDHVPATPTTAGDTHAIARELLERDVDLLLFAGGDGTARDVVAAVGTRVPVLGIPSGVKMRSAVFGTTPEAAGEAAARYLANPGGFELVDREVLDAADGMESELFALARSPHVGGRLQRGKATAPAADEAALTALCETVAREMAPGRLYLVGPGTTTARILAALGIEATPLGVDAVLDGTLLAADVDEESMLRLLDAHRKATLVLGVIGGQGFLLGRGNQQISARVLDRVGVDNLVIVAGADKVAALDPPVLHVDLGDAASENLLEGYRQVRIAPNRSTVLRISGG
jgi:predicted polyphosphate/ATP-dependent NAD kinase